MTVKVSAIEVTLIGEKTKIYLPVDENLKIAGVNTIEELEEKWSNWSHIKKIFEPKINSVEIEVERPNDFMTCPNFRVVCFKEKMYAGWGTFFSCWSAYEFGGLDCVHR